MTEKRLPSVACLGRSISCAAFASYAGLAVALFGASPAASQASLEQEVSGIRSALEEIVVLLRAQASDQRAELLLRQLTIKSARLSPIESELRSARTSLAEVEDEIVRLEIYESEIEDRRLRLEGRVDNEAELEGLRMEQAQVIIGAKEAETRRWQFEQRVVELENQQRRLLDEVATLEQRIDELLQSD